MNDTTLNNLQSRLYYWLTRKTLNSGVRRVGELPLVIGSDVGLVRQENQDRVAVLRMQLSPGHYFVVAALCDGMGGMTEGSACAAQAIAKFFTACIRNQHIPLAQRVVFAAQAANENVYSSYKGKGGATLSAVLFDSNLGMVGLNVGDSRLYSYQESKLEQITIDDTMAGVLKNDVYPKNELLQYIGMGEGLEPHVINVPAFYESIILTTDGVHFIDKQVLQMVIQFANDLAVAVRRLIDISKWCGGRDNASVVAIRPFPQHFTPMVDLGSIQIWDPFGELQILIFEQEPSRRIDIKPIWNKKPIVQEKVQNSKRSTKPVKKSKPAKQRRADKIVDKKENTEAEKGQPQLNIYFNESEDKADNG